MILNLIITYIWFGATIPEDYLINLNKLQFPIQVLINPPIDMPNLPLRIQKADYYRLKYLEKGGVYSDFDNEINYTRLMERLTDFDGQMLAFDFGGKQWAQSINNGFLYVPANRTELVRQMVRQNKDKICKDVTKCFGPQFMYQYHDRITKWVFYDSVVHHFDFGWSEDSNIVNHFTRKPSPSFRKSRITKGQIANQIQNVIKLNYSLTFGIFILAIWSAVSISSSIKK